MRGGTGIPEMRGGTGIPQAGRGTGLDEKDYDDVNNGEDENDRNDRCYSYPPPCPELAMAQGGSTDRAFGHFCMFFRLFICLGGSWGFNPSGPHTPAALYPLPA